MPKYEFNISIDINVDYYERRTNLTDQQIAEQVYKYVKEERNILAREARIASLRILDGEDINKN